MATAKRKRNWVFCCRSETLSAAELMITRRSALLRPEMPAKKIRRVAEKPASLRRKSHSFMRSFQEHEQGPDLERRLSYSQNVCCQSFCLGQTSCEHNAGVPAPQRVCGASKPIAKGSRRNKFHSG